MGNVFELDGKFSIIMSKAADLLLLNLLWILCSLPVITIGASTTALYAVLLDMAVDNESYVVRSYFRSFITHLKKTTRLWLFILSIHVLLGVVVIGGLRSGMSMVVALCGAGELFFLVCTAFIFPLLAWNVNLSLAGLFKASAFLGVAALPWTVVLLFGWGVLALATWYYTLPAILLFLFAGVSGCSYMMTVIYRHVFEKYRISKIKDQISQRREEIYEDR